MSLVDMVMPQMGESIAEGTIVKWMKKEGERVEKDEIILEISTDKVDSEIPSPEAGVVSKLLADEGKTVQVGEVIAKIDTDGNGQATPAAGEPEAAAEVVAEPAPKPAPAVAVEVEPQVAAAAVGSETVSRSGKFFSPLVRNIARAEGVSTSELEQITGTGAGGRVTKKDLMAYLESRSAGTVQPATPSAASPQTPAVQVETPAPAVATAVVQPQYEDGAAEIIPMDNMRKAIAHHMIMSIQTSAHVYAVSEADMTGLARYRTANKAAFLEKTGVKLTYMPFIIQACVKALLDFPLVNSSVEGDNIVRKKQIGIGLAVALENNGLIVPVIKNADSLNIVGLARSTSDLAQRSRNKKLKPDEVQGGTFSITNMGSFGTLIGMPIINQPQVAILGIGVIQKRPVVIEDAIAIRDMMYISLSFDHRIVDGSLAGQFLERIAYYLSNFDTNQIM